MAAIARSFTRARVAEMLDEDEDEDFRHAISIDMAPEGGVSAVHGCGDAYMPAFSEDGIDNLKELIPMYRKKAAPADPTRPRAAACDPGTGFAAGFEGVETDAFVRQRPP